MMGRTCGQAMHGRTPRTRPVNNYGTTRTPHLLPSLAHSAACTLRLFSVRGTRGRPWSGMIFVPVQYSWVTHSWTATVRYRYGIPEAWGHLICLRYRYPTVRVRVSSTTCVEDMHAQEGMSNLTFSMHIETQRAKSSRAHKTIH